MRPWDDTCEEIAHMASAGYYLPDGDHDDLLQEARVGVWKGLRDYDPAQRGSFEGFLFMCARRMVVTAVKTATRIKHRGMNEGLRLEGPIGYGDGGEPLRLADVVPRPGGDPLLAVLAAEEARELFAAIAGLTAVEREAVERVLLRGEDYAGDKRTDNALQRARRKLRQVQYPEPAVGVRLVYVDRRVHPTERAAERAALEVAAGRVVSMAKRKLLDGRDLAPQGRPDGRGRRGQPVWRVELEAA